MTDLEILKFNLQEDKFPHFSDSELQTLLDLHGSVDNASYEGCLIKSYDDSTNLGPISTPSNTKYWLRMASKFKSKLKGNTKKKSMSRADGT